MLGVKLLILAVVVLWLLAGLLAAAQRDYLGRNSGCAEGTTTALTVLAGPLNYFAGVNPKIDSCEAPQPAK